MSENHVYTQSDLDKMEAAKNEYATLAFSRGKELAEAHAREAAMVEALTEISKCRDEFASTMVRGMAKQALSTASPRAKQILDFVAEARRLKFGAYPAHGVGYVITVNIVASDNLDAFMKLAAALDGKTEQT